MPDELDKMKRAMIKLEIEKRALKKEKEKEAQERLAKLEKDLAEFKDKVPNWKRAGEMKRNHHRHS